MLSATRPSARSSCFIPQSRRGRGQLLVAAQAARPQKRRRAQQQQLQQRRVAGVGIEAMFAAPQSKRREEPPRCPERPAFHLAPPNGGWVNDPNAPIVDKDGRVHVVSGKRGVCFSIGGGPSRAKEKSCPESMSDARGAKEEEERFPSRPLSRSLPSSLAFSLQLKLEQDARTLSSWHCFERRGPERENEKVFRTLFFFSFGRRREERARATDERRRRKARRAKKRETRLRSSPLVSSPSRPRHRRAGAGDAPSRRLPLQTDETTTGWGQEGAGSFPLSLFDFFASSAKATWLRSEARLRRTDDKGRNFSVTFLPLSLVAAVLRSSSALSLFPEAAASRHRQSGRERNPIEESTGEAEAPLIAQTELAAPS